MFDKNHSIQATPFDVIQIENLEPGDSMISDDGLFSVIYYDPYYTLILNVNDNDNMLNFKCLDSLIYYLS